MWALQHQIVEIAHRGHTGHCGFVDRHAVLLFQRDHHVEDIDGLATEILQQAVIGVRVALAQHQADRAAHVFEIDQHVASSRITCISRAIASAPAASISESRYRMSHQSSPRKSRTSALYSGPRVKLVAKACNPVNSKDP